MPIHPSSPAHRAAALTLAVALGAAVVTIAAAAAQAPPAPASAARPQVPDWAHPGTATRTQVAPPPDFRRPTTLIPTPIGIFDGQAEVGTPIVPGSASFDPAIRPMHAIGPPVSQRIAEPFYVGIGFCSHLPDTLDTTVLSNVVLENAAGKVR
jgi:hypothetical protein